MVAITPEERRALIQAGSQPVRAEDPDSHEWYVILKAEVHDRLRAVWDDGDFDVRETYPLVWEAMHDDWEDPAMEAYDAPESP